MKMVLPKLVLLALSLSFIAGCDSQADEGSPMAAAANETAAMLRMRSIATAEQNYKAQFGSYGTLEQLIGKELIGDPSKGKLGGYKYEAQVTKNGFQVTAVPEKFGVSGKRSFFIDQSGVLRGKEREGQKAQSGDPAI